MTVTSSLTHSRTIRGVVATGATVALAAAGAIAGTAPAHATTPDEGESDFAITVDGYYATATLTPAEDLPIPIELPNLSGSLTIGDLQSDANSAGVPEQPAGVNSRAYGSLITAEIAGVELDPIEYSVEQVAPPEEAEPARKETVDLDLAGLATVEAIYGEAKANWDSALGAEGGVLTSLATGVGQVDVVGLDALGPIADLLPVELPVDGALLSVGAGQLNQETGTFANEDGTLGAYAEVSGRFGDINLLGGAENGGVSVGLAGSDDGTEPNSWGRLEATGQPGGATFDYELPALELQVADQEVVHLEPGVDQTIDLLGASLNVNVAEYREEDTVLAEDGTAAAASGGGAAVRLTLSVPVPLVGDVEVLTAEVGLLSFPEVSVTVPTGGIQVAASS